MEVTGKRAMNIFSCKPCEESDVLTQTNGFCTDCEEYMCSSCFNAHKKYKLNRDHTLIDCNDETTRRESSSVFEKCEQHSNEAVKFYCVQHKLVGCGDCMIIGHRSCKVDYILDKAEEIKGTAEFKSLTKEPGICKVEAEQVLSSLKNNKVQIDDINERFKQQVNMFREEIILKVNNLSDRMLKEGESIKAKDKLSMTKLSDETESLINDLNDMSDLFKAKAGSPSQFCVCLVSKKPKLDYLRKQIDDIRSRNIIDSYELKRDTKLSHILASIGQLGKLQKDKEKHVKDEEEIKEDQVLKSRKSLDLSASKRAEPQPLLDRQLMCRNIKVEGEYLSYLDNGDGLYVDKNEMRIGSYFEVEIISLGQRRTIATGFVSINYLDNMQLGWSLNAADNNL
ncbi:transcription intermediary factor 1-alpha-like [Ruditapes philippinarum]|uniref:transcription intermediary factor 1-alpha-like n=1 Tax=Ruditapes philippinarum TaxID=129788 RepID=UPI00295A9EEE|nr:transcription intermediary factor 1-alpha-like [Ruditapes philippinarum]